MLELLVITFTCSCLLIIIIIIITRFCPNRTKLPGKYARHGVLQTTTPENKRILAPYTMCRRASNNREE